MKNRSAPKGEKQRDKRKETAAVRRPPGIGPSAAGTIKGVSGMNILNIEHVSKIYGEKSDF